MAKPTRQRVVIIGGGFGGLNAARALKHSSVDVTLIDRRNFHLFQPLLYQVATGGLSPANIAAPIRRILHRQKNASVILGNVSGIDPHGKTVRVEFSEPGESALLNETIAYDFLVVAAGSTHSYFGNDQWADRAPGLKTIEDATEIRARVFNAFEAAEHEPDPARRAELMRFVIVGGGPTGVELAGAIAELARNTLRHDFRNINPPDAKIVIVDGQDRVLNAFPQELSKKATDSLERLGIEIIPNTFVTDVNEHGVKLKSRESDSEISARTVLWAAGVAGVPLGKQLAQATGIQTDKAGRVPVEPDLSLAGHPDIFVIGDLAEFTHQDGKPLPGVAQVAMQQGKYAGRLISNRVNGKSMDKPFYYKDLGNLATIGRRAAVADLGRFKFSGLFAWLIWVLVHIMQLAQYQNRALVFLQWSWNYFTFNRSARLITEQLDYPESHKNKRDTPTNN